MAATGSLAAVVAPALGGELAESGGIALPFVFLGATVLVTAPLYALLPETRAPTGVRRCPETTANQRSQKRSL
jgi:hypothetical protein